MKRRYSIKSKLKSGGLNLTYSNGILKDIKISFRRNLSEKEFGAWLGICHYRETDLQHLNNQNLIIAEVTENLNSELATKIKLFCVLYKKHNAQSYKVNQAAGETRFLKDVEVTEALLEVYMTCDEWWAKPKTMQNYGARINQIVQLQENGKQDFPNDWSPEIERKYTGETLSKYWEHLRKNGWKMQNTQGRKIWVKTTS